MYDDVTVQGKKLAEWAKLLHNQLSLGEAYRLAKSGKSLAALVQKEA